MSDPAPSPVAAFLAETAGLVAEQDALVQSDGVILHGRMTDEFNAAQDRLAARVPALVAALEAVLKLHAPVDRGGVMYVCRGCEDQNCLHKWPCSTISTIETALRDAQGGTR